MMQINQYPCDPRIFKTYVIVIVGPPGVGKSSFISEYIGEHYDTYYKTRSVGTDWWDSYHG